MKRIPTNTTEIMRDGGIQTAGEPMSVESLAFNLRSGPGFIEAQEALGQAELICSDVLPAVMTPAARAALEAAGVVFGARASDEPDEIWQECTLPAGWKKMATNHAMWSDLRDEKGRKRAAIFYKAAYYDRSAKLHICQRFTAERDYECAETTLVYHAKDGDKIVFSTPAVLEKVGAGFYEQTMAVRDQAETWLTEQYPRWRDPAAYWDLP